MSTTIDPVSPDLRSARADLYRRMRDANLAPLWEVLHSLTPPEPVSPARPAHWSYDHIRRYLAEAGNLITAREAIRRVLVLENPALPGESCITQSLYAGLQMILPGEAAPPHRHSQSAIRLVLEGSGAFTTVDGEQVTMQPGDFLITPSWTWHGHGNPADEPVVWLDGLDIRIVQLLAAQFCEDGEVQEARAEGWSRARFGRNMLPVERLPQGGSSPLFKYPYAESRAALASMASDAPADPWQGWKLRYANPVTGGPVLPTMTACLQLLPAGFSARSYRATDGTIFAVVEGDGVATVGPEQFAFKPRDIIVVPSWAPVRFDTNAETVLFSFSDRPAQEALGLWREARA